MDFKLKKDQFNRLFPFYILIDNHFKIKGFGKSIAKILPLNEGVDFSDLFLIKRPELNNITIPALEGLINQLLIIEYKGDKQLSLRGQVELIEENNFLFLIQKGVNLSDFFSFIFRNYQPWFCHGVNNI